MIRILGILVIVLVILLARSSQKLQQMTSKNEIMKKYINKLCVVILDNIKIIDKIDDESTLELLKEYSKKRNKNTIEKNFVQDEIKVKDKVPQKSYEVQTLHKEAEPQIQYTEKDKENDKNTMILATGSILIVFSAIVFLISAWSILLNSVKTVILALLMFVFFEASSIAKNKFKLEKASKTFFYIGMAYIPICLLSLSFFGLVGKYLSINGEGKYIYLFFAMLCTAIIYGIFYLKTNSKVLVYRKLDFSRIISNIIFICN